MKFQSRYFRFGVNHDIGDGIALAEHEHLLSFHTQHLCRGDEMWFIRDIVKNGGSPLEEEYDPNPEEYWRKRSRMEFERMVYAFAEKYGISLQQAVDNLAWLIEVEQGRLARKQFELETGIELKGTPE